MSVEAGAKVDEPRMGSSVAPGAHPRLAKRAWANRLASLGLPLVVSLGLAAVWQAIVSLELVNPIIFPSPLGVVNEVFFVGGNLATGGYILPEAWTTLREVLIGFVLAASVGFSLGTLVGVTDIGRRGVMPILVSLNTMPKVAFAPVFIAWFGFGMTPKILMAMIIAIFPVIVNTASGLMAPTAHELKLFRQLGASRGQLLWKLQLPSALPSIFAGLRTAAVFSVIGAVIGEFIGGGSGMGELIRVGSDMLRMDRVFGLIIWLSLIGLMLYGIVGLIERRVVFWKQTTHQLQEMQG